MGILENATITFSSPGESWGVDASAVGTAENGVIKSVSMVSNGRGYSSAPTVTFSSPQSGVNTATGTAILEPTYYVINESTPLSSGICTVTVSENVPYAVGVGTTVPIFKNKVELLLLVILLNMLVVE